MGYSHYWNFTGKVAPKDLRDGEERFAEAARIINVCADKVKGTGVEIAGGDGNGNPVINERKICFNGKGKESHETFCIALDRDGWDFCKTAHKPYDILVCLSLLAFKSVFGGDFDYTSDGITKEDYEDRENNEYWKKINFVPEGPEKEWQAAYKVWEEVRAELGLAA